MSDPDWRTAPVSDRIRDFCITNPTNCGNAAIIAMLLKEFRVVVSNNQVAGALSRMKVSRGGYRKPITRTSEEIAWTNPRKPDMLTQHSQLRENGLLGFQAKAGYDPALDGAMKSCTKCDLFKPEGQFALRGGGMRRSVCNACRMLEARHRAPAKPADVRVREVPRLPPAPAPAPVVPMVRLAPAKRVSREMMEPGSPPREFCSFPLWSDTERPTHRYCCEPVVYRMRDGERVLSSYCGQHQAVCHIHMRSWTA